MIKNLYFKNYVCYSKFEAEKENEGLTILDILSLKQSPTYYKYNSIYRKKVIQKVTNFFDLCLDDVLNDKYTIVFISHGMIQFQTDKEFFDDLNDRFT
jgi:hypothetical protein